MTTRRELVRNRLTNRVPETFFDMWPSAFRDISLPRIPEIFGDDTLRVEEFREGDEMIVRVDLPGIDPEKDVEISAEDGLLQVRAERRHTDQEAGRDFYRSEIRYGAYERTLPLPAGASADDVKATYADGVLEIRVPIPPEKQATSTKVPVTRG